MLLRRIFAGKRIPEGSRQLGQERLRNESSRCAHVAGVRRSLQSCKLSFSLHSLVASVVVGKEGRSKSFRRRSPITIRRLYGSYTRKVVC